METSTKITPVAPNQVLEMAVNGYAKAIALRLGKCVNTVYKMFAEPEFCRYTRFLQVFFAIFDENESGADLLFEDFRARYFAHKMRRLKTVTEEEWFEQLDLMESEYSQALRVAIRNRDAKAIRKELSESIIAQQQLLAMLQRREDQQQAQGASG